jgi:hypothetical protein
MQWASGKLSLTSTRKRCDPVPNAEVDINTMSRGSVSQQRIEKMYL